jgi:DNA phosphorothioation-dependent restriction protein DptH
MWNADDQCLQCRAGSRVAEVLLALQRHSEFADLRYDIRLFALDPCCPGYW